MQGPTLPGIADRLHLGSTFPSIFVFILYILGKGLFQGAWFASTRAWYERVPWQRLDLSRLCVYIIYTQVVYMYII